MKLKNRIQNVDLVLLVATILLIIIGLVAVTSASFPTAKKYNFSSLHYLIRQSAFLIIGIIATFFILRIPKGVIYKNITWIFPISILLIILLWTPLGKGVKGQVRWLEVPILKFRFQPSDILKISAIVFFAKYLSKNIKRLKEMPVFLGAIAIMGISVGPIMIKDFSTAVVIGFAMFVMLVAAGLNKKQFLIILVLGVILVALVLFDPDNRFRLFRIFGLFSDSTDYQSADLYQARQSLYAFALGGYSGVGLFRSRQKYTNLPEAYTDFIFSVIAEEFGFIGSLFIVILFMTYIYRGFIIAYKATNFFDKFVAVGLSSYIGIQAFFNMGVGVKLLPVTGITLPFISYGGTALVIAIISTAMLLKISKQSRV
ncbi:putative lipid II flippase FtsW [Peptoniphilus sp. MSJ-1]|uniref:Probable peptidoglycan glycosyltransferase FtsW n=1 Tax=Peptoniphilus ovalis TaxID=2841503 RepID=A0ABS6FI25_9FIRM|nr:putative peptidoglycan glycosyltransferase FtsW [Peptoniphilus ovalis]MBU5669088.1 putative lipid II flippase FtsW [Peptoniphilus ovalis]